MCDFIFLIFKAQNSDDSKDTPRRRKLTDRSGLPNCYVPSAHKPPRSRVVLKRTGPTRTSCENKDLKGEGKR